MTEAKTSSPVRRRPAGSPLIAAGSSLAKAHLFDLADQMGLRFEFVELDESGKVKIPGDAAKAAEVELLWCHGRFLGSWVMSAINSLPSLDWVHSDFVGVDGLPLDSYLKRGIIITNGGENFARPMAEWVMLGILASAKQFPFFVRNSDSAKWDTSRELAELDGSKVLLLGLGSVNSLVAQMCKGFGLEVVAWTRTKHQSLADGVSRQVTGDQWLSEIASADYLVVGLPLTAQTRGLINREVLETVKSEVTIINLARGALIDEAALVQALDSGRIHYALLDAHSVEPLPPDSPLWRRRNVTVLPHHSWSSPKITTNSIERFRSELTLWLSGQPLLDPVDFSAGY
ncbi:MAG: D-2-hydroxyacid dehydrogenase [Actinomycetota bacterium]|nr:MAG: D-2-hydroxyacid dehydrogenase [Actinomycetota bacterium]